MLVHSKDLILPQERSIDVHEEFTRGHFVTNTTKHRFSALAHDQINEQQNAIVKGDGGFVGLTEKPDALRRWMVSAPETSRIHIEASDNTDNPDDTKHHEEKQTKQNTRQLVETIDDMGNPFEEDTSDLYTLDKKVVMSPEASCRSRQQNQLEKLSTNL
ncbi:hypothetical protein DPMN_005127 [Dreissena polymorpha]|uniref:Uncharacterized protein n=1 Tax=Dreissena polymorpha TaxID=45954 RepID=A0A9D4RU50_DREPO|nr:hypothetical protein DPMN_005127 [Dreissena polymorpha]